jgi:hypothetical protein
MIQYIVQSLRFDWMVAGNCYLEEYNFDDATILAAGNYQRVYGLKVALFGLQVDIAELVVDIREVYFQPNELGESLATCKGFPTLLEANAETL